MIPAKAKDFIPELAKQLGIPEEDYSNMLSFYFKENKKVASNLDQLHIILRGLGTLNVQGWKLKPHIAEALLKKEKKPEEGEALDNEVALYNKALEMWMQEKAARRDRAKLKKEYYTTKTISDHEAHGHTPDSLEE